MMMMRRSSALDIKFFPSDGWFFFSYNRLGFGCVPFFDGRKAEEAVDVGEDGGVGFEDGGGDEVGEAFGKVAELRDESAVGDGGFGTAEEAAAGGVELLGEVVEELWKLGGHKGFSHRLDLGFLRIVVEADVAEGLGSNGDVETRGP
eukprot:CAMPEP_0197426580 /NCGR_PEP_ID=MMETSP1170-20131217/35458_1 /TAXON_ID=54406 /ORGANISM="Sarcinochrysis sp, Strain CCMP770" /LENGTH=146 /DNA_ID=CAMNT_0042954225 /DNA_START=195 /DNA_END=631 /DNA_ORIENTATION=+